MLTAVTLAAALTCPESTGYWYYPAHVTRVVDGDTVEAQLYVTPELTQVVRVRFLGVDAPELNSKDLPTKKRAIEARDFVAQKTIAKMVLVHWCNKDSFGRVLGELYVGSENLAETLLNAGLAVPYTGK